MDELEDALSEMAQEASRAGEKCYAAIARVVDSAEQPVYVWSNGAANGMSVTVQIQNGPFAGAKVAAMIASPLGAGFESSPLVGGQRVLVHFLDGTLDGIIVATHTLNGGKENPLPAAVAGIQLTSDGIAQARIHAPPKGVGVREYIRGGQYVIRLKGDGTATNPDGTPFVAEFFVEGDDGAPPNNTAIAMAWDPNGNSLGVKIRHSSGAFLQVAQGAVTLQSANGENRIEVTDDGVTIMGTVITLAADKLCDIHGGNILLNMPPLTPPVIGVSSVALGPGAPLNLFSATVHCGP